MSPFELVISLERAFRPTKKLQPEESRLYQQKLGRFSENQLVKILDKLLERCKFFPKIAEIWEVATDLGYLATPPRQSRSANWQPSGCKLCGGEGRLLVFMLVEQESRNGQLVPVRRLRRIFPYSAGNAIGNYQQTADPYEYGYLFRCSCAAGADGHLWPKTWPQWKDSNSGYQDAKERQLDRQTAWKERSKEDDYDPVLDGVPEPW